MKYITILLLKEKILDKDFIIQELLKRIALLEKRLLIVEAENKELKERLSKYETPKDSHNSSIPPSKDENRPKRKSLCEKTGRKPGGQKGRKGNTLKMLEIPDDIEKHIPSYCNCCGKDLSSFSYEFAGKRQVFDIPEIKIKLTEHQVFAKVCTCGHETTCDYPFGVNVPVSYGNNVESLVGYFHSRQYLPFMRMKELFNNVFHLPISEGGIQKRI